MIKNSINVDMRDENGNTALMIAAREGLLKVINILASPDIEQVLNLVLKWKKDDQKLSKQNVQQWIYDCYTADVNARNTKCETALMFATKMGHYGIAKWLIGAGANVDARDIDEKTPLMIAAENYQVSIAKLLIEADADIDAISKIKENHIGIREGGESVLLISIKNNGGTDIAKLLIDAGADINHRDKDGTTPLILVVKKGSTDIVKWLLRKGADVNATVKKIPPLFYVIDNNYINIVKLLIDAKSDINIITRHRCDSFDGKRSVTKHVRESMLETANRKKLYEIIDLLTNTIK